MLGMNQKQPSEPWKWFNPNETTAFRTARNCYTIMYDHISLKKKSFETLYICSILVAVTYYRKIVTYYRILPDTILLS